MSSHKLDEEDKEHDAFVKPPTDSCVSQHLPSPPSPHLHHIRQSDSGICLTSRNTPSPLQDHDKTELQFCHGRVSPCESEQQRAVSPSNSTRSPRPRAGQYLKLGNSFLSNDSRSSTPDMSTTPQPWMTRRSSDSMASDSFVCQTKCVVLQFLHQSTNEEKLLHMSHNCMSTTSESETRFLSHAEELRWKWQSRRSQSTPFSTHRKSRSRPLVRAKSSVCVTDVKDSNRTRNLQPKARKTGLRKSTPGKSTGVKQRPPRYSPIEGTSRSNLIQRASDSTDSENGTYFSDADDELDTSFDSSHHGSTTSATFKNRLAHLHYQQQTSINTLPTVESETESMAEMELHAAEETLPHVVDDGTASSILSLDMISLEQEPVSPTTVYARVNDFLVYAGDHADVPDMSVQADFSEVDSPSFNLEPQPSSAAAESWPLPSPDEGMMSGGFDLQETLDSQSFEVDGAWGGADPDEEGEVDLVLPQCSGADRSKLTLDLIPHQHAEPFGDVLRSLQQEIEEEMSSFETEYEEAVLQGHQTDRSCHSHMSLSRCFSPDSAEAAAARMLARIGDEVQEQHFARLHKAMNNLLVANCAGFLTYENFNSAARMLLDGDMTGRKQVATLLLYSRQVVLYLARTGQQGVHRVIDYTVQLLADLAPDFFIKEGGWAGLTSVERGSMPSSPDCSAPALNPFLAACDLPSLPMTSGDIAMTDNPAEDPSLPLTSAVELPLSLVLNESSLEASELTIVADDTCSQGFDVETESTITNISKSMSGLGTMSRNSSTLSEKLEDLIDNTANTGGEPCELLGTDVDGTDIVTEQEEEANKDNDGEGVVSSVGSAVMNSRLLTRCAVSVGFLAVGAAVAFSLTRS